jgi:2-oxo-3-hexenedioate decarboxylase
MITVADAILHALDHAQPMAPITDSDPDFDLAQAYAAQALLTARRKARGAKVIGLKVGFTNTTIWAEYGIDAPILGPVFDTTLTGDRLNATSLPEPKIEPEVVLRLSRTPTPDMDDAALLTCVDAIAAGFEIVQSPYPDWRARLPDTVAAGAMHGALRLGPWQTPPDQDNLRNFSVTLLRDGIEQDTGTASNLLGSGPLMVLRHILTLPGAAYLVPGALISTGTVTRALPAEPGLWVARYDGLDLPDLTLTLT